MNAVVAKKVVITGAIVAGVATIIATKSEAVMQEFSMVAFFCIGWGIFRIFAKSTRKSKPGLDLSKPQQEAARKEPVFYTASMAQGDFRERRYERILDTWNERTVERTGDLLLIVADSLLALGRPDELGLIVAKAAAHSETLRSCLQRLIKSVATPVSALEVSRGVVGTALCDICDQARCQLDQPAVETLAMALAAHNEEKRVELLLQPTTRPSVMEAVSRSFLNCKNVRAALSCMKRVSAANAGAVNQDLLVGLARCATVADFAEEEDSRTMQHVSDVLTFLESTKTMPSEALTLLLDWTARQSPADAALAQRLEQHVRKGSKETCLPLSACDALFRIHAGVPGHGAKAIACFDQLIETAILDDNGLLPSEGALMTMLSACMQSKNADVAQHILRWAEENDRSSAQVSAAAARALACGRVQEKRHPDAQRTIQQIRACGQDGDVKQALELLRSLPEADTTACNSALDVCITAGDRASAYELFRQMRQTSSVDAVSFNILLKQPNLSSAEVEGICGDMRRCGLQPNTATYNSIISAAFASGDTVRAWRVVDMMTGEGGKPDVDVHTVSIILKGYRREQRQSPSGTVAAQQPATSLDTRTFDRVMNLLKRPLVKVDEVLVNLALETCMGLRDPGRLATTLELFVKAGWSMSRKCDMHTYGMLIKAYGQSRQIDQAWSLWAEVTRDGNATATEQLYGQMIDALVSNERLEDATELLSEMKAAYSDRLNSRGFSVAYAMIIRGHARRQDMEAALRCYEEMQQSRVEVGLVVFNTLIDACSRVGNMDVAANLYLDMVDADVTPDLITYSTLIKGYCVRGEIDRAMELLSVMRKKGITADAILFNSLLDGCAKQQKAQLCEQVVREMEAAGISPSNYSVSILIKLHGRCNDVDAAFRILDEMPRKYGFKPNVAVYTCLMSTCIANNRMELATDLLDRMIGENTRPDEKTYATLLRGALKTSSVDSCLATLKAALNQRCSHLLDEQMVQSALNLFQRKRVWDSHGAELLEKLRCAGVAVQSPRENSNQQQPQSHRQQQQQQQPQRRQSHQQQRGEQRGPVSRRQN